MEKENKRFNPKFAIIPMLFIVIFLLNKFVLDNTLFEKGAMIRENIENDHQWYRALTTQFLHSNWNGWMDYIPLLANSFALYYAYIFLSDDYEFWKTTVIFLICNLVTILVFYFSFNFEASCGPSPGIFGLVGFWLFNDFSTRKDLLLTNAMSSTFLKYYLVLSNFAGIDTLFIHIIGTVIGGLLGFLNSKLVGKEKTKKEII